MWRSGVVVLLVASTAYADRPLHGSIGGGSALLVTGDNGDRQRFELEADVEPYSRWGGLLAWRHFNGDHKGILAAGIVYEAGAARPRLVIDFHGDVGFDLDQKAPMAGGGLRTVITIVGQLGLALDSGGYLVIDGVDHTRFAIALGASLVARF
ncbi:MAG: hypothetical protein JO257_28765 [Deltaproteobacteria bacterium]|nr:hypothetical protein [Deltaproteobacteria bacterium]